MTLNQEECDLLRSSIRGLLKQPWPIEQALASKEQPVAALTLWQRLRQQGLTALGAHAGESGVSGILQVHEALRRASCPEPLARLALIHLRVAPPHRDHAFGATGYAKERELPRHFRRVHGDLTDLGAIHHERHQTAPHLHDSSDSPRPDEDLGPTASALQQEVKAFLQGHWIANQGDQQRSTVALKDHPWNPESSERLRAQGRLRLSWPKALSGQQCVPDPEATTQARGISVFLVPLNALGITMKDLSVNRRAKDSEAIWEQCTVQTTAIPGGIARVCSAAMRPKRPPNRPRSLTDKF